MNSGRLGQMLEKLHLKNVGPAPELEMEFAPRVNLITGDNGLGKSFLLEVGWWILTNQFAIEMKPNVQKSVTATILGAAHKSTLKKLASYDFAKQSWEIKPLSTVYGVIVISARVDGKTSIFDFQRALLSVNRDITTLEPHQLWNGLEQNGKTISNGLIRDWATWQLENAEAFQQFKAALATLSPHEGERLEPGKLTRVSLDDARDIPTLKMPYGQEVPITQASAGIRRVVSLAYMLVWTWQEHLRAAELTRQEPAREIVLLIDELEQHLHPRWQRVILPALLETVKELMKSDVRVQIIATTHSPMVLASLEPLYDGTQDAWFDLNLVNGTVTLEKMPWRKRGDASAWLTSEAFDLPSSGSLDREGAMDRAAKALLIPKLSKKKFLEHDQELRGVLGETDPFWIRWRYMGEKKGWL